MWSDWLRPDSKARGMGGPKTIISDLGLKTPSQMDEKPWTLGTWAVLYVDRIGWNGYLRMDIKDRSAYDA